MWRRIACSWVAVVFAMSAGCEDSPTPDALPELLPAPTTIDEAVQRRLDAAALQTALADDTELCRRLFVDFIGRLPSAEEVAQHCAGRTPEAVAAALQSEDGYVVQGLRRWRDRLDTSDASLYWADLRPALDLVEQLQRQEIDYSEFAVALLAEPGLMALDPDPTTRAMRVHRVFLGDEPTEAEATDLARLTRIWDPRPFPVDAFGGVIQESPRAYVVPGYCGPLGECSTQLNQGGSIAFPDPGSRPFRGIKYELLTDEQRASLRGLGMHVVSLPGFWESAADEVLDRLLGWSDGGVEPRRPGRVLPEVRELVAEHLRQTQSIASAERLIVSSLLYRQTHRRVPGDLDETPRPVWATGPFKPMNAEVILDTVRGDSGREGTCDPRTADDEAYAQHRLGLFNEPTEDLEATLEDYDTFITEFHARQGNWRPLVEQELVDPDNPDRSFTVLDLDRTYFDQARSFGGCPGAESPRLGPADGLPYAMGQEVVAGALCEQTSRWLPANGSVTDIATAVFRRLLSRNPTETEYAAIEAAACSDCDSAEITRGICLAVMGSGAMLFY